MRRLPTALLAALTLVVGFAVAQGTGVRWLGGAVLLLGGAWCVAREAGRTPAWRLVFVVIVALACFVLSHVLAGPVPAWVAVAVAAGVLGGVTAVLVGRSGDDQPSTSESGRSRRT